MSYLERYIGKRRIIKKALKIRDQITKVQRQRNNLCDELNLTQARMTGGDKGAYDLAVNEENNNA